MVTASNGQVGPVSLEELPSANGQAQSAQRARSVPPAPANVTERDGAGGLWLVSWLVSGGSLLHAQPPSLAQAWTRHRQSAAHYEAGVMRWPRYAWGAVHVALKAVLHSLEWVTDSPPKLFCAALIVWACWFFS